jgi:hypothetical protein
VRSGPRPFGERGRGQDQHRVPPESRGRPGGPPLRSGMLRSSVSDIADDLPDVEEDAGEAADRRRRMKQPRRKPTSMLATISDESALLTRRPKVPVEDAQARRGAKQGGVGQTATAGEDEDQERRGRRRRGWQAQLEAKEEEDADVEEQREVVGRYGLPRHPEEGIEDSEPEWHALIGDQSGHLPLDKDGIAYTLDPDGEVVEDEWDTLSIPELIEVRPHLAVTLQRVVNGAITVVLNRSSLPCVRGHCAQQQSLTALNALETIIE